MQTARRTLTVGFLLLGASCWATRSSLHAGAISTIAGTPILTAGPGEFNSSEQCGGCHRDIHSAWKESAHALALEDPLFLDALRQLSDEGADIRVCLGCHAPTTKFSHDFRLEKKLTWEGITCDYCHSISRLSSETIPKLVLEIGTTKFGPIEDAVSGAHETQYSELFKKSEMCASCHEYVSPSGVAILTTYSDWMASPQAKQGKTCQTCHMSEVKANVVDPRVARSTSATVNLHSMPGGHSIDQLNRALVTHARVNRAGGKVQIEVDVVNRGAGHAVPTGSAARQIVLEVRVDTNTGSQQVQQRVYERVLTDAAGRVLCRDGDVFARAARLQSDSRLRAGETRHEKFVFDVDGKALANVKMRLVYRYAPEPNGEPAVSQIFYTQSWTLPPV